MVSAIAAAFALLLTATGASAQGNSSSIASQSGSSDGVYNDTVTRVDVPVGSKTYMANLRMTRNGTNICAGVLISPTHVLTTAVCMEVDLRWAYIGSRFTNGTGGELFRISAMLPYPSALGSPNDVMVVELASPSSLEPIALPAADGSDTKANGSVTMVGWPWIKAQSAWSSELQSGEVTVVANEQCSTMMPSDGPSIDDSLMCVGGRANEDPCGGDIGSAVIVTGSSGQDMVVGVIAWGYDCYLVNMPSVLARVSSVRSWIDSVLKGSCVH